MEVICNSLQFRFPIGTPPPSWEEVADFVKLLKCDPMHMEAIYKLPQTRLLCIKFKSMDEMEKAMKLNAEELKFHYSNGKVVDVHMSVAGRNVAYVRVFDLPPEVPDNDVLLVLANFGHVSSMVREKFPAGLGLDHLFTGVRGAYVDMEKDIPAALEIANLKVRIFHDGLKGRCFLCNEEGHRKDSCPQRKKGKPQRKRNKGPVTYAGIVESGPAVLTNAKDFIEMDQDHEVIEVLDEEILEAERVQRLNSEQYVDQRGEAEQRTRQEQATIELTKFVNRIKDAVNKQAADERRAQFAASSSGSVEMLRPKKTARKS